jgi:hypothetical protein
LSADSRCLKPQIETPGPHRWPGVFLFYRSSFSSSFQRKLESLCACSTNERFQLALE